MSKLPKFQIDDELELLFSSLPKEDYEELEKDIIENGCHKPLKIWRNHLIDGHARYDICKKNNIRFLTKYIYFDTREEVIDHICTEQMKKTHLTEEMRKYLIGKKYEMEKIIGARENYDSEKYQAIRNSIFPTISSCRNRTATAIGQLYGVSYSTVYKYNLFSKMIDSLHPEHPAFVALILAGHLKISHSILEEVVKLPSSEITKFEKELNLVSSKNITYKEIRSTVKPLKNPKKETVLSSALSIEHRDIIKPEIKNLPEYDPDGDIKSLMLTIPSWISSIGRTKNVTVVENTSDAARMKLIAQLENLQASIDEMMIFLKGATNDGTRI